MVLAAGSTSIFSFNSEALKSLTQARDTRKSFSAWLTHTQSLSGSDALERLLQEQTE